MNMTILKFKNHFSNVYYKQEILGVKVLVKTWSFLLKEKSRNKRI